MPSISKHEVPGLTTWCPQRRFEKYFCWIELNLYWKRSIASSDRYATGQKPTSLAASKHKGERNREGKNKRNRNEKYYILRIRWSWLRNKEMRVTNWACIAFGIVDGKQHNKNGNKKEEERGGRRVIAERSQKHWKRMRSYRGQCMRTCSTVSMVLFWHVEHISDCTRARLWRDWLRRARLKRRRDMILDTLARE